MPIKYTHYCLFYRYLLLFANTCNLTAIKFGNKNILVHCVECFYKVNRMDDICSIVLRCGNESM